VERGVGTNNIRQNDVALVEPTSLRKGGRPSKREEILERGIGHLHSVENVIEGAKNAQSLRLQFDFTGDSLRERLTGGKEEGWRSSGKNVITGKKWEKTSMHSPQRKILLQPVFAL